jgi:hypothetical protein
MAIGSKRKAQQSEFLDSSTSASIQSSLVSPEANSKDIFEMLAGELSLVAFTIRSLVLGLFIWVNSVVNPAY